MNISCTNEQFGFAIVIAIVVMLIVFCACLVCKPNCNKCGMENLILLFVLLFVASLVIPIFFIFVVLALLFAIPILAYNAVC